MGANAMQARDRAPAAATLAATEPGDPQNCWQQGVESNRGGPASAL